MRLPRFTTRRLMVAVAAVALLQRGEMLRQRWVYRSRHFDAEAKAYWRKAWAASNTQAELSRIRDQETALFARRYDEPIAAARQLADYYQRMAIKYQGAA